MTSPFPLRITPLPNEDTAEDDVTVDFSYTYEFNCWFLGSDLNQLCKLGLITDLGIFNFFLEVGNACFCWGERQREH